MSKINELMTTRAKAWDDAKAFLDSHRNDKGILSAEDTVTYDKMEKEIADLTREIERQQRADALERQLSAPTSTPITEKPEAKKKDEKTGRASDTYKNAFWNQMRDHSSVEVRNALSEGVDTEGGFLVPETFEKTLISALHDDFIFRSLAKSIRTSGNHKIPVVATRGTASWVEEAGAIPESDDAFGQKSIGSHKLTALIKVSEELLNDSAFDLEGFFSEEF